MSAILTYSRLGRLICLSWIQHKYWDCYCSTTAKGRLLEAPCWASWQNLRYLCAGEIAVQSSLIAELLTCGKEVSNVPLPKRSTESHQQLPNGCEMQQQQSLQWHCNFEDWAAKDWAARYLVSRYNSVIHLLNILGETLHQEWHLDVIPKEHGRTASKRELKSGFECVWGHLLESSPEEKDGRKSRFGSFLEPISFISFVQLLLITGEKLV